MPSPRWRQIDDLFQAAVTLAGEARDRLLDHECSDDAELRQQVEELLAAHDRAATFLERPAGAGLTVGESDVGGSDVGGSHAGGSDAEVCWVGRRLGPYEILSELGRGGMSIVYLAQRVDHELESQVAIKRLAPPQATVSLARRFRVERQILARLDHPGIARILDAGTTEEGTPYFVMERIEGEPIDIYCDRRRLGLSKRLELFRRVCVAVAYAHRNLVVHRDLKPKNILVTGAGEPKLLDFGIAKLLAPENFPQRVEETSTRLRPMTPRYASPEQAAGEPINTASDVYSLAVLLYELLTGRSPYTLQGRTASEIEAILQHEVPPPPSEALASADEGGAAAAAVRGARPEALRRALAGDLDRVVLCALHKEAEERYGSVERFSDDLGRYLAGRPIRARPDSRFYRLRKFVRRHLVSVATAGVVAVVLLGFTAVTVLQARRIERERDGARRQQLRAEEVTTFLLDVFGEVDPSRSRGERVTAREVLDRGARRVEQQLAGEPELQATLMHTLGDVYGSLGLYEPARRLLDQATENRRRLLGGDHPAVAESLHARGEVLLEQGNMAAAEAVATEALEIHRKRQPEGAAEAAASGGIPRSLDLLGRIRRVAGDRQEAIALHTQALELRRQSGSAVDGEHIRGLSFLAAAHRAAGDLASSAAVYRQALDLQRELQAGDHPVLAEILHNLAVVLRRQGDLDEAEATCRSALAINRRLYGERHSSLARNLNSLALIRKHQGEVEEAAELNRQSLKLKRELLGEDHPRLAISLSNLAGLLLHDLNRPNEAESLYREAIEIYLDRLGDEHPNLEVFRIGLGQALIGSGQPAAAETVLRGVLARSEAAENGLRVAQARSALGDAIRRQGRLKEAEPLLTSSHAYFTEHYGAEDVDTVRTAERLAGLYRDLGQHGEAASDVVPGITNQL